MEQIKDGRNLISGEKAVGVTHPSQENSFPAHPFVVERQQQVLRETALVAEGDGAGSRKVLEAIATSFDPTHADNAPRSSSDSSTNPDCPAAATPPNLADCCPSDDDDSDAMSEKDWKPCDVEALQWVQRQMVDGSSPQELLCQLLPNADIPDDMEPGHLWHMIVQLLTEPPKRKKLAQYNTLEDAVALVKKSSRILVITGAGVQTNCVL